MEYIINNRLSKPKEPSLWYMKQNRIPEHVTYEEQVKPLLKTGVITFIEKSQWKENYC